MARGTAAACWVVGDIKGREGTKCLEVVGRKVLERTCIRTRYQKTGKIHVSHKGVAKSIKHPMDNLLAKERQSTEGKAMSKVKELASDCGLCEIDPSGRAITDYGDHTEELMAFYHAVRAEALREAAESCAEFRWEWNQMSVGATDGRYDMMEEAATACEDELRAMADREGKE